jgi:acetate kinase
MAAIANTLGGLDGIVFTAGVGEHQPEVRQAVCNHLAWLGVNIDPTANVRHATQIQAPASAVMILVLPADEEQTIADEAFTVFT